MRNWSELVFRSLTSIGMTAVLVLGLLGYSARQAPVEGINDRWVMAPMVAQAAATGVGQCLFYTPTPPSPPLATSLQPCRLDSQFGMYVFVDNTPGVAGRYNSTMPPVTNGTDSEIQIDSSGRVIVAPPRTILVPATGTAPATLTTCTSSNNLVNGPVILVTMIHEGVTAETSGTALSVYDEGSSPTCATNDLVFTADQLGATQFPSLFNVYLKNGLTYKWQQAPTSGVRFGYIVP